MKHHPRYKEVMELLDHYIQHVPKKGKALRKQIKKFEAFIKKERNINEGIAHERYYIDYNFFNSQLFNFIDAFLHALTWVLTNAIQHPAMRSDEYQISISFGEQSATIQVIDKTGFRYFKYEYGCERIGS